MWDGPGFLPRPLFQDPDNRHKALHEHERHTWHKCSPRNRCASYRRGVPRQRGCSRQALEEAAQRRLDIDARAAELAKEKEHRGRGGLEPVRYEDWEVKGLASDF